MKITGLIYVDASPAKVWDAIVSPDGLWKAMYGAWIESSFKVGEKIEFLGPGNEGDRTVHIYGKVLGYEPFKTISYTEHSGPSYRPNHAEFSNRVTFTFEAVGQVTKLSFVSDEWTPNHPSYAGAIDEWPVMLSQ